MRTISTPTASTTKANERIEILDILRGFAIFGILAVNITTFVLPNHDFSMMNFSDSQWCNQLALWFNKWFTEGKFYILFSFLFGIGFSVQLNRMTQKDVDIFAFYPRRLAILFVIGVLHSFLWWGDVLRLYAILGMGLLLLRKLSVAKLLLLSALFLGLSAVVSAFPQIFGGENIPNADSVWYSIPFALIHMGPTAFALFLLGRVVGMMGFFDRLHKHTCTLKKMMVIGLVAWGFLQLALHFVIQPNAWQAVIAKTLSDMEFTSVYVAVLCLMSLNVKTAHLLKPIANVGRMALTNYVMQTLICVAFFKLFALEGKVESANLLLMTVIIYALQMWLSGYWLSRFHYGLLEWVWRSLTLGQRQGLVK